MVYLTLIYYEIFLYFIVLLLFAQIINAQESKKITLDFKTKEFTGLGTLEGLVRGDIYKLEITNLNLNLYKVEIGKKDTIIASGVEFPTFDTIALGGVGDMLSQLSHISFSQTKKAEAETITLNHTNLLGVNSLLTGKQALKEK